jgi:hypothetical protein
MSSPWWENVPRWTGHFRNQQKCSKPELDVLIVGEFDLPATGTPGLWSGTLSGELKRYRYRDDDKTAWDGAGTFIAKVNFNVSAEGYRLEFPSEERFDPSGTVTVNGSFNHVGDDGKREVLDAIQFAIEDTWGDFFDRRIPSVPETPEVIACVVQLPEQGKNDNHREHWVLIPNGYRGLLVPRPLQDGNLWPPFHDPENRPPHLSDVIQGDAAPLPDPGPPPQPIPNPKPAPPRDSRRTKMSTFAVRQADPVVPEAMAIQAYVEDDDVDARVVHFAPDCPALGNFKNKPKPVPFPQPILIDEAEVLEEFGARPCVICMGMLRAGSAREITRLVDSESELLIYDDRIASFAVDGDTPLIVIRLADVAYFTISGWGSAKSLFLSVSGDYLFAFKPDDKKKLDKARDKLIRLNVPEGPWWRP